MTETADRGRLQPCATATSWTRDVAELKIQLKFENLPNFPTQGEFFPKRAAPVVRQRDGARELAQMMWGFPPPANAKAPVTNIRNLSSPFWRSALPNPQRRCLVPVSQFAEPDQVNGTGLHWFALTSDEPFCFAGIWRPTEAGDHYAFLTTEANAIVGQFHPKAMPVILRPDSYETWVTADMAEAARWRTYPSDEMRGWRDGA